VLFNEIKMSFADLLKLAEQGDAESQYKVGNYYCVRRDYTQAIKYYKLSAEQNHPKALNEVGCSYYFGNGVNQNYKKAFEYYLLSAEQKCLLGYGNLAYCYKTGCGVKKDLKKALTYFYLRDVRCYIGECEQLILDQFSETLNESDYLYAYPLYIKHNHKGLSKLKTLLNKKYIEAMYFIPSFLGDIIISFLL